ncbi:MAG TPA: hypothetical protein VHS09_10340 [Polyangiaceae bacterium]|nr:hypothetical protein [Polyangiaceae bacterium]
MAGFVLSAALAATLSPGALAGTPGAGEGAPRVHIKGSARIEAHTARASGKLVVSGTVLDDAGRPIAGARVAVGLGRGASPAGTATLAGASPDACSEGAPPPVLERGDLLSLPTDDAARFCVRLALPTDRYVVHLESPATGFVDGARLDLAVDLALEPVTLRFEPERSVVSLDDETTLFEVVASTEDDGVTTAAVGIPLVLTNEEGTPLGSAMSNASGRARFPVDAARLGPPGRGELRVSFAGSADAGPTTHAMQVERRTHVDLTSSDAIDGRLPVGSPEEGAPVHVRAVPRCARRGCVATPTGTVEARDADGIVGAAPLAGGAARVVATFAMPAASEAPLRVRYVPDAPWFQSGGELALTLPMRAPSPWKKVPLVLAGLAALAWLILARLPSRRAAARPAGARTSTLHPEAGVALVRAGPAARGWTGRVHDAHDGFGVAGARVAIERPGFHAVEVVVAVTTNADGVFVLPPVDAQPGDRLLAEAPVHAALRRPVPPAGELDVALVLRKRALLDRLVAWARRRGKPFDARVEPTPGHVQRAAASELAVARWAEAVERAAYGEGVVDEAAQEAVDRLAPAEPSDVIPAPGDPRAPPRPGPR